MLMFFIMFGIEILFCMFCGFAAALIIKRHFDKKYEEDVMALKKLIDELKKEQKDLDEKGQSND